MHRTLSKRIVKNAVVTLVTPICAILAYYFHSVLGSAFLFSYFLYLPVGLTAFRCKRKGLLISLVPAGCMIVRRYGPARATVSRNDFLQALPLMITALIVALLYGRIEKTARERRESEVTYRLAFTCMHSLGLLDVVQRVWAYGMIRNRDHKQKKRLPRSWLSLFSMENYSGGGNRI